MRRKMRKQAAICGLTGVLMWTGVFSAYPVYATEGQALEATAEETEKKTAAEEAKPAESTESGKPAEASEAGQTKEDAKTTDTEADNETPEPIVYQTITIQSTAELQALARNCELDAWSTDKRVELQADLDLSGIDGLTIPYFNGIFVGGRHRITGYHTSDGGYITGLFRHIGPAGQVQNLTLEASVSDPTNGRFLGGLCGINEGVIRSCTCEGRLEGHDTVGAIAAINEVTALIADCRNHAHLSGYYFTGGIAGKNYGTISGCSNSGSINDSIDWVVEDDKQGEDLLTDLATSKTDVRDAHLFSGVDTGGITGYSKGSILRCTNTGDIGYEHVGYNVGGIAGRQMGIVSYCRNSGTVSGRKDIGGIVGQMEPWLDAEAMASLPEAADKLHDLVDSAVSHMDGNVDVLSGDVTALTGYADNVVDDGHALARDATDMVNTDIAVVNNFIARIEYILDALPEVIDHLSDTTHSVYLFNQSLARIVGDVMTETELSEYDSDAVDGYTNDIYSGVGTIQDNTRRIENLSGLIGQLMYETDENGDYVLDDEGLRKPRVPSEAEQAQLDAYLNEVELLTASSEEQVSGMAGSLSGIYETYKVYAEDTQDAVYGEVNYALDALADAEESARSAAHSARSIVDYVRGQDHLRFRGLSSAWDNSLDSLRGNLKGISHSLESLNQNGKSTSHTFNSDLQAINDQVNVIYHIVSDRLDIMESDDDAALFTDVSDEELEEAVTGRVDDSTNTGAVRGDINVGGIAGSMAIDEEDPEENAAGNLHPGSGSSYTLKNIICDCRTDARVRAKKDGAGLIVGYMAQGVVSSCEGCGTVSSTEGAYVGGIAGESLSVIRDSSAVCLLSGARFVGGITGYGTTITGCTAMPTWETLPDARYGAIAGQVNMDEDTMLPKLVNTTGNRFVAGEAGGIDNISYDGIATPVSYATLMTESGIPQAFRHLKVTYEVDEEILGEQELAYGASLDELSFPEGNPPEGGYIVWSDVSGEQMDGRRVITGSYEQTDKAIESETTYEDTEKPLVLAGGSFGGTGAVSAQVVQEPAYSTQDALRDFDHTLIQVDVSTEEGSGDGSEEAHSVRLYNPYKDVAVYRYEDGHWTSQPFRTVGHYIELEDASGETTYALVERSNKRLYIIAAVAAVVLLIVLILFIRAGRRIHHRRETKRARKQNKT